MNSELQKLYFSKWDGLCASIKPILEDKDLVMKPTNPLLLYLDNEDELISADFRVMIFGQETNRWYGEFNTDNIKLSLDSYDKFFNHGRCWRKGGQYWNGVRRFLNMLQEKFPDKKIRHIWNNIVKIGNHANKGFPPDYIYEIEREFFSVIKDELQIIKPNVVLFLTGPNYDSVIVDNFGQLRYTALSPFSERRLSKVEISGIDFAFRTYHPNFLWRNDIDSFFQTIINEIKL